MITTNIKKRLFLCSGLLILSLLSLNGYSQILPASRIIDWTNAGVSGGIPDYPVQHSVLDFDAVADGVTDNRNAFQNAINATNPGNALLVPAGTYYLSDGLNIDKGIALRGEGLDKTILVSDSHDNPWGTILIDIHDENLNKALNYVDITAGGTKDSNIITVSDVSSFAVGDYVLMANLDKIILPGGSEAEDWPRQHAKIEAINGNSLTLNARLYHTRFSSVAKIEMLTGAGVEGMYLKSLPGHMINQKVRFFRCANSWVKDCEMSGAYNTTNVNVVYIYDSYNCEARGNYVHNSQEEADQNWHMGYGIISSRSTGSLYINNMLDYLRHSLVHGGGSGGGVMAYNFCWTTVSNGVYDMQSDLDGHSANNPYQWLIEGNCSNIYRNENDLTMTVLRNKSRGATEGITFNDNTTGANIIGNQLDRPKYGNVYPYIKRTGLDAIAHGNYTVKDGIGMEWDPNISDHNIPDSYFLSEKPEWFGDFAWPPFGGDLMVAGGGFNPNRIPAEVRYWTRRFPENVPANLSVVAVDETTNKLDWTSNSSAAGQVDKIDFIIVRSTNGKDFERIATTEQTSFTDTGLMPDRSYWYYVRARNHVTIDVAGGAYTWSGPGGESDPSNTVAVGDGILSVEQGDLTKKALSVFPNPANDVLHFNLSDNQAQTISIYSSLGKLISKKKYTDNSVNISGLDKGMYFLVIKGIRKNYHAKFIIE